MKTIKFFLLAIPVLLVLSGCLTSQEPFYQESDVRVDDRLLGDYRDESDKSQTPTCFYISPVDTHYLKGHYYVTVASNPNCEMKFHAVLFQVGTNRFLDMMPEIEACDRLAANPPSLNELLKSATLQPLHMAVSVEISTNGVKLGFADHAGLVAAARKFPEYFQQLKPEQFPRMVAGSNRQREFLLRFGGETNIFKPVEIKRGTKPSPR